ncbi:MAG: hypothetical protein J6Q34_04830 [Bacteroidales bacterium]|nr:hypothetical protein [Bacteroidales bacterium]
MDFYASIHIHRKRKVCFGALITHRFPLSEIEEAYRIFENKLDGVIKVAVEP